MSIQNIIRLAQKAAAAAVGGGVTIQRGTRFQYGCAVVWGRTEAVVQNFDGTFQNVRTRDAIIDSTQYRIGDEPVAPVAGDRLSEPVGEEIAVWEVQPFAGGSPAKENDPLHVCWRVHLKELGRVKPGAENTLRSMLEVPAIADGDFGTDDGLQAGDEFRSIEPQ